MSLITKIHNTYKQFGLFYLVKSIFKRLITPIVSKTSFYILAIENHTPVKNEKNLKIIDVNNLEAFFNSGIKLSKQLKRQLTSFIPQNTIAIIIIKNNQIAGWGFVQQSGISKYGGYDYELPQDVRLLKNLYVEPGFRGKSIGKYINRARIDCMPKNTIPIVFVIPSNKFAIRNLEMYEFRKQVLVKDYSWFNKYHIRSIKVLGEMGITNIITSGFKTL